jgi:hypothetical protein
MVRRVTKRLLLEECRRRIMAGLSEHRPQAASEVARHVWPEATFRNTQGAALAVGPILAALKRDGLVLWQMKSDHSGRPKEWGWLKSPSKGDPT